MDNTSNAPVDLLMEREGPATIRQLLIGIADQLGQALDRAEWIATQVNAEILFADAPQGGPSPDVSQADLRTALCRIAEAAFRLAQLTYAIREHIGE